MRPLTEREKSVAKIFHHPKAGAEAKRFVRKGVKIVVFQEAIERLGIKDIQTRKKVFEALNECDRKLQVQSKLQNSEGMHDVNVEFRQKLATLLGDEQLSQLARETFGLFPKVMR